MRLRQAEAVLKFSTMREARGVFFKIANRGLLPVGTYEHVGTTVRIDTEAHKAELLERVTITGIVQAVR